jgi:hypothetical protein
MSPSHLLKTETDPVFEKLRFLIIYTSLGWARSKKPIGSENFAGYSAENHELINPKS